MAVDAVAEVKSRLDLVEVIGSYFTLHRKGREFTGLCPFHAEKTPSFSVRPDRQVWFCHGCHEGGDLFTFIERIERIDFRQALELLADRAGVELEGGDGGAGRNAGKRRRRAVELNLRAQQFFAHVLRATPAGAAGRELLAARGVSDALTGRFGIGFAPAGGSASDALTRYLTAKAGASIDELVDAGLAHPARGGRARDRFRDRLVFPIRDERGQTLGFGARALGDAMPKYLNTPDTVAYHKSAAIFGLDLARDAIAAEHTALIVEGYFDVIAAHTAGIGYTVASSGTALTREQVRSLGRMATTLVLCFDNDDAGRLAASRAVDVVAAESLQARICVLPGDAKDPDELVRRDPESFAAAVAGAAPEWQVLLDRALAGGEGGSVDARRAGAERAVALLVRIPEATTRELYMQQSARRLDLGVQSLTADLGRAMRDGGRRPARVVASAPVAEAPAEPGSGEADDGPELPMPRSEEQLAGLVLRRPDLAPALTGAGGLRLEELTNPTARRIIELGVESHAGEFPLRRLGSADQRRAAGLLVRDLPELADDAPPEALERLIRDCIERVHELSLRPLIAEVRRELHRASDEGREADVAMLATRLTELAVEAHQVRQTFSQG